MIGISDMAIIMISSNDMARLHALVGGGLARAGHQVRGPMMVWTGMRADGSFPDRTFPYNTGPCVRFPLAPIWPALPPSGWLYASK